MPAVNAPKEVLFRLIGQSFKHPYLIEDWISLPSYVGCAVLPNSVDGEGP
jgi:hypothetical protein